MKTQFARMTFVAFCDRVLGLTLTNAQRVVGMLAIDHVQPYQLDAGDRAIADVLTGGVDEIPPSAYRKQTWSFGRASGKTTEASAVLIYMAVTAPLDRVGPGMTPVCGVIAPRLANAQIDVHVARELVRAVPSLERMVDADDDNRDGFSMRRDGKRVRIGAYAASRAGINLRSADFLVAIFEEAELFASDSDAAVTDRESVNAVMPRLLHGAGHHAILVSTPWPAPTLMGELFTGNFGAPSNALALLGTTLFMRDNDPTLAAEIAEERASDPDNTARERDCDRSAVSAKNFFDGPSVDAAIDHDLRLPSLEHVKNTLVRHGAGADVGLIRDSSALVVCSHNDAGFVGVRALLELRPKKGDPLKLANVVAVFAKTIKLFGIDRFVADGYNRQAAREYAVHHGVTIDSAPEGQARKFQTYVTLQKKFHEGKITIPNDARLIAQLKSTVAKPVEGGKFKIIQPRNLGLAHGDMVSALVLATSNRAAKIPQVAVPRVRLETSPDGWLGLGGMSMAEVMGFMGNDDRGTYDQPEIARAITPNVPETLPSWYRRPETIPSVHSESSETPTNDAEALASQLPKI